MPKNKLSVLPQDLPVGITTLIRNEDNNAIIYPASVVLSQASDHFTKKEIQYIKDRQKELFKIQSKSPRVVVVRSEHLTQDKISSLLYFL